MLTNLKRKSAAIPNNNNYANRFPQLKAIYNRLHREGVPILTAAGGPVGINLNKLAEVQAFEQGLISNMNPDPELEALREQARRVRAATEAAAPPNKKSLLENQMRTIAVENAKKIAKLYKKKYGNLPPNIRNRLQ